MAESCRDDLNVSLSKNKELLITNQDSPQLSEIADKVLHRSYNIGFSDGLESNKALITGMHSRDGSLNINTIT